MASKKNEKKVLKWSLSAIKSLDVRQMHVEKSSSTPLSTFEALKPLACNVNKRICIFCHQVGDGEANGPSRMLSIDVDQWCHLNCALWSDEVYETMNGALINVDIAFKKSVNIPCSFCNHKGASIKCFYAKCSTNYHLTCAIKDKCTFNQDKVRVIFYYYNFFYILII